MQRLGKTQKMERPPIHVEWPNQYFENDHPTKCILQIHVTPNKYSQHSSLKK